MFITGTGTRFEEGISCKALCAKQHFWGSEDGLEERSEEGEPGSQAEAQVNSMEGLAGGKEG